MKVAYLGIKGLPAQFGADRVVEAIASRLSKRHDISVYCSDRYTSPKYSIDGIHLIRVPSLPGKFTHMTSVNFLAGWHAVIYCNYDLIHLHNTEASFILPLLKLRYRVVATAHGRITKGNKWNRTSVALMRSMELPYGLLADAPTSVSLPHAQEFSARFARQVRFIPNGIEPYPQIDVESSNRILESKQILPNQFTLFVVGRLVPLKGAHLLTEAFRQIDGNHRLVFVGDVFASTKYAESVRAQADARTIFIPFIESNAMLLGLMQASRLVVLPSLVEAMSITLLEAASVGAPILCSDIPANTAVLSDAALYFRAGDANDLADKLRWALAHPDEMCALGACAQARVREHFSWDHIAKQYESLYNEVVNQ